MVIDNKIINDINKIESNKSVKEKYKKLIKQNVDFL